MKFEIVDRSYNDLLEQMREYFNQATQNIWDRRNKIKIVTYNNKELVVKSFKVPHFINKLAYTFIRPSKAERSYTNSLMIKEFVPMPIGYVEYKKFGLLYDSYFVSEHYKYDFTIRELLTQKEFINKDTIFKQFAIFTYALHEKNVKHLDYSPGNILIKQISEKSYEFKVIDVNRMKFKILTIDERLENFSKLWANDNDLICIVKAYAKISNLAENESINIALKASQKHKEKVNLKKKLKGKKVVN